MPNEPTEIVDLPLPLLRTSRRKAARELADKIGPVDPDFDHKASWMICGEKTEPARTGDLRISKGRLVVASCSLTVRALLRVEFRWRIFCPP